MNKRLHLLLSFFCISGYLLSQDAEVSRDDNRLFIGGSVQYGFLWAHRYTMGNLVKKHIAAAEIDLYRKTSGAKAWHEPYLFPQSGLALVVVPLGNPEQLGYAFGIYPYINFPFNSNDRKLKMYFRYGWGVGWLTKKFDPLENHKNIAIGSHLNTCFSFRLNAEWKLDEKNHIEFGLGMIHFSNGCVTMPNLGLNIPMLSAGYSHRICNSDRWNNTGANDTDDPRVVRIKEIISDHSWHFEADVLFGLNDVDPPGGNKYGVANLLFSAGKYTSRKSRWSTGFDLMCSQGIRNRLAGDSDFVTQAQAIQYGIKGGYELVLGRITLPVETGVYLYTRYKGNGPVYSRFGVHYLATDHLLVCFNLKTHFAKAEYWETGIAWRF